jgi:signal peptidase I
MDNENKTPGTNVPSNPMAEPTPPVINTPLVPPIAPAIIPPLEAPVPSQPISTPLSEVASSQSLGTSPSGDQETNETESTLVVAGNAFKSFMGGLFSWVIFPIIIVLILHNFVFQAYHVLGSSMINTLHETDYLIISKVGYTEALVERMLGRNKPYIPARGQIIVFHYPNDPTKVFVKRVIGLPGDRIVIKNGYVTIFNAANPNGINPDKGYEPTDTVTLIDTDETIAEGFIFVMGDNRSPGGSYDSREWGQLKSTYIIGNAVLRLLPLDQAKIL